MPEDRKLPNFDRQPVLWLALSFAVGILATKAFGVEPLITLAICVPIALAALFLRGRQAAAYLMIAAFAVAGFTSATIEQRSVADNRIRLLYDNGTIASGDPVEVEGVLLGRPEPSYDGVFLTLRTESLRYRGVDHDVSGRIRLFMPDTEKADSSESATPDLGSQISDLKYGSRLRIACKLNREDAFLNPGVIPRKDVLDRLGIDVSGSVKSPQLIEHIADESVFLPLAWIYDQRSRLIEAFRANLSSRAAGVMIASLLGDKYFLDKETADLFRDGGTFHILVISGLHITFIGGLIMLMLRRLTRRRWVQFGVTTAVLWAYTLAVGADVPVVRAAVMFTAVLAAYVIYRQVSLLNSLGISSLVLLVWRPSDLLDPSFQLTFVSVAAIVTMAVPLVEKLRSIGSWTPSAKEPFPPNVPARLKRFCEMLFWNADAWAFESKRQIWSARILKSPYLPKIAKLGLQRTARFVFEGLLVSLIIQIWMLPLAVIYFHRISVVSVVLNIWVGIFIAAEGVASVAGALVASLSGSLAKPFFAFAELSNGLMLTLPRLFSDNGIASFRLPAYTGPGKSIYFLFSLPVLFLALAVYKWRPFDLKGRSSWTGRRMLVPALATMAALIAIIVAHPFSAPRPDGRLHIDFLDVGQGDSALLTFPDGRTMLIDGGGRINYKTGDGEAEPFVPDTRGIGEAVVSEFLWYRGYSHVDAIVATHADADHIQGLADVAKNFSVGAAYFGRMPLDDPDYVDLAAVLQRRGIPSLVIARGDTFEFGDVAVDVLYPIAVADPNAISDNNHSVVFRVRFGDRTFLLTGDIESPAERDLLAEDNPLNADLVKVPHHGSRTSSTAEFINAVRANYAVISVGRTSPFGHPHPDVVERWRAAGVNVLTTGTSGTISVSTDGHDLQLNTFAQ